MAGFLALGLAGPLPAQVAPPSSVQLERDVVYGRGGDVELKLDLARPTTSAGPTPAIVFIHGGGWKAGSRNAHLADIQEAARRGYVAVTVSYRFAPEHRFPAQVEDVKCAVRFLRAHAEKYGVDPKRIGATGVSAGGHLAMMLGAMGPGDGLEGEGGWEKESSRVKAVVNFVGPADLAADDIPLTVVPLLRDLLGGLAAEKPEEYRLASPIHYVSQGDAPTLIFAGTLDPLVPPTQAWAMAKKLTREGVPGRVELLLGQGHGFGGPEIQHAKARMYEFFQQHLRQ